MSGSEGILVYLDSAGKWRWVHRRGSRKVAASSQGYANKHLAVKNMESVLGGDYAKTFETRSTRNGRAYQQGTFTRWAAGPVGTPIHVEVIPWEQES